MTGAADRKQLIAGVYDRAADGYAGIGYFPLYAHRLAALASIPPGAHVLDVACGRGAVLFAVAGQSGFTGSVTGVDISQGMVDATAREIASRGLANATAQVMDAEDLEFADFSFDRVLCAFSLQFFPGVERALAGFYRVLKASGRAAISTWGADDPAWDWYDGLVAEFGAKPSLRTRRLDDPGVVTGLLTEAGFTSLQTVVEQTDFVYRDEGDWWNMRWSLSGRAALEQLQGDRLRQFTEEATRRLQAMRQPDGFHELQEVIYTLASRH